MRGFAGKVSSLANFNMVLEALKAHFPQQLYTLMHTIHYLARLYLLEINLKLLLVLLKTGVLWVRKETSSSSSENSFHFSKIVQKVKRKCKHLLLFFCGVLHKKSKACANNNNKIPKSMWIIDRATAERQITLWKISHQSLAGHPLERRIFLCHGIGSPGFLCYDQSPWCFQVQPPPFPQFWETYWRAVKTPSLKREMKKNPKCAPPFLFFASLSFVIPRATLKYSEKVKWNKWYWVKLSVSSPSLTK